MTKLKQIIVRTPVNTIDLRLSVHRYDHALDKMEIQGSLLMKSRLGVHTMVAYAVGLVDDCYISVLATEYSLWLHGAAFDVLREDVDLITTALGISVKGAEKDVA